MLSGVMQREVGQAKKNGARKGKWGKKGEVGQAKRSGVMQSDKQYKNSSHSNFLSEGY